MYFYKFGCVFYGFKCAVSKYIGAFADFNVLLANEEIFLRIEMIF